jgi:hypothetical protein
VNNVVHCNHCNFEIDFNTYKSKKVSTTLLIRHCEQHHLKEWMKVNPKDPNIEYQNDLPWNEERIEKQNVRCLKIIIKDLKPFSFIQSLSFQHYSKGLCEKYTPPTEKKIRQLAIQIRNKVFESIKKNLKEVKFYSMTIDGWSSNQAKHFINFILFYHNRTEVVKVALTVEFVDALIIDGEEINKILQGVIQKFELDGTIIFTTDSESDIRHVLLLNGSERIHCILHFLNLSIKVSLSSIENLLSKLMIGVKLFKYEKGNRV